MHYSGQSGGQCNAMQHARSLSLGNRDSEAIEIALLLGQRQNILEVLALFEVRVVNQFKHKLYRTFRHVVSHELEPPCVHLSKRFSQKHKGLVSSLRLLKQSRLS